MPWLTGIPRARVFQRAGHLRPSYLLNRARDGQACPRRSSHGRTCRWWPCRVCSLFGGKAKARGPSARGFRVRRLTLRVRVNEMSERPGQPKNTDEDRPRGMEHSFSSFATWVAKWTGSQWAFIVAAFLVLVGLLMTDMATTNLVISIVTLLMVLVLQNTENRHSAALHVKLDEVVRAEPEARDDLRGVESRPEREIRELTRDDEDALFEAAGE
jgi:low affinity Fe/Cu permease